MPCFQKSFLPVNCLWNRRHLKIQNDSTLILIDLVGFNSSFGLVFLSGACREHSIVSTLLELIWNHSEHSKVSYATNSWERTFLAARYIPLALVILIKNSGNYDRDAKLIPQSLFWKSEGWKKWSAVVCSYALWRCLWDPPGRSCRQSQRGSSWATMWWNLFWNSEAFFRAM